MKTDDLIQALGADAALRGPSLRQRFGLALAVGAALSLLAFAVVIGPRADWQAAAGTYRYDLKFIDTLALLAPSFALCVRLSRPEARPGALVGWLLAPVLLLGLGVALELLTVPRDQWMARLVGHNMHNCMTIIPILSLPPLAALLFALRAGAPRYPALTGALAGVASAGLAATFYASNCTDDSPLFVATWYPLATAIVAAVGALAGRFILDW